MALSIKQIQKLRSGQTVWRVWGLARHDGTFSVEAERHVLLGKKVSYRLSENHYSTEMVCKRPWPSVMDEAAWRNRETRAMYLSDLQGLGCFRSVRAAERFVKEVNADMHPDITDLLFEYLEADDAISQFRNSFESYNEDYKNTQY
jgi:hypothetical protein